MCDIIIIGVVRMAQWLSADFSPDRSGVQFPPVSGQTATLVGRVATPVIPVISGTQPVDQGWKGLWNCKGIAQGSKGWRASPLLVSHHNLRINPVGGRPGSWDLS